MERPARAPQGIDLTVPSVSRIHDYYLGGSHNFEVDREAGRTAINACPSLPRVIKANRAFTRRAVRYAVATGVTQFLDIGSGIPAFGNVHEVAGHADPRSRVVYVDNDLVAVEHGRAVLQDNDRTAAVCADFRSPLDIMHSAEVERLLDLDRPVALLMVSLLHFVRDEDEPWRLLGQLRDVLASGSLLVVTHASDDGEFGAAGEGAGVAAVYRGIGSELLMRSRSRVLRFFDGWDLVEPGLVAAPRWGPDASTEAEGPAALGCLAGVGRKTERSA